MEKHGHVLNFTSLQVIIELNLYEVNDQFMKLRDFEFVK